MSHQENSFTCREFLSLSPSYMLGFWILSDFVCMEPPMKQILWENRSSLLHSPHLDLLTTVLYSETSGAKILNVWVEIEFGGI